MTVKEVICAALRLVGRDDVADALEAGESLSAEHTRTKNAFLAYFNSVIDELARAYFPPETREEAVFTDGRKSISSFMRRAVRIKRVTKNNMPVKWRIYGGYVYADEEEAEVVYEYAPAALGENDAFYYPEFAVGERLVEYGMAAEHYLVLGCAEESRAWEEKYRQEIEALMCRSTVRDRIPPRRWV